MLGTSLAEDVHWITGEGNNTDIATRYGTAAAPLNWFDPALWFTDDPKPSGGVQTPAGAIPVDGQSVAHSNSCCNPEPFVTIDNGGLGVNLPNSAIRFDAKTNLFDSGAGDLTDVAGGSYDFGAVDDALIADTIAFNGAGGQNNEVFVPVVANTFTSNRHGAVMNAPFTVNDILSQSGHQEKWVINASSTGTVNRLLLDENRGPDGESIDGSFRINVDMIVTTIDHIWSRLIVGDPAATLTADTYNHTFYSNQATNNSDNPLQLDGNMVVENFNLIDVVDGIPIAQADGTWGAIGSGADNEVSWITGSGILTVGSGIAPGPKFTDIQLLGGNMISLTWRSQPGKAYAVFYSEDLAAFVTDVSDNVPAEDGETTTLEFEDPTFDPGDPLSLPAENLFFKVQENG